MYDTGIDHILRTKTCDFLWNHLTVPTCKAVVLSLWSLTQIVSGGGRNSTKILQLWDHLGVQFMPLDHMKSLQQGLQGPGPFSLDGQIKEVQISTTSFSKHFKVKQQLTFCWLYRCIIKSLIQYALRNSSLLVLEFRLETGPELHSLNKLTHTYPSVMPQTGSFRWLGNITVLMANIQQHDP